MSGYGSLLFSVFISVFSSALIVLLFRSLEANRIQKRITLRRQKLVSEYSVHSSSERSRNRLQFTTTKLVIDSYGNRFVGENYKNRLQQMLVTSGDWENKRYASLIRRKVIFAFLGFFVIFIFLLLNNLTALPIVLSLVFTFYILPNIDDAIRRLFGKTYKSKLEKLLDRAGSWDNSDYFKLVRRKVFFATAGFIIGYLYLVIQARTPGSIINSLVSIAIGFFLPDLLLQNRVLKRKELIANSLPDAIDMLQMCVSAGLAFPAALTRVAETQSGPVAEEFSRVTTEVQLGRSRPEALAGMAERTQEKNVQKFVSAMQQVSTFGIPILNVLTEQSKEMRAMRREMARERGQKVPIKILAPIMLCFLPTVIVIVLGPAVIALISSFG
jgi:tight adherence protein C